MTGAAIGWKSGELRLSDRQDFVHGDPDFKHVVYVQISVDGTPELSGFENKKKPFTFEERTVIGQLLWQLGYKRVRWTRVEPDGRVRVLEFSLKRFSGEHDANSQTTS